MSNARDGVEADASSYPIPLASPCSDTVIMAGLAAGQMPADVCASKVVVWGRNTQQQCGAATEQVAPGSRNRPRVSAHSNQRFKDIRDVEKKVNNKESAQINPAVLLPNEMQIDQGEVKSHEYFCHNSHFSDVVCHPSRTILTTVDNKTVSFGKGHVGPYATLTVNSPQTSVQDTDDDNDDIQPMEEIESCQSRDINIALVPTAEPYSVSLTEDGNCNNCGANFYNQLSRSIMTTPSTQFPRQLLRPSASRIEMVACGTAHTAFLLDDKHVYSYGSNYYGQLGCGSSMLESNFLVKAKGLYNVKKIVAGDNHMIAITERGDLYMWGYYPACGELSNLMQPLKKGFPGAKYVDAAGAQDHTIALTADGCVHTIGASDHGALGLGPVGAQALKVFVGVRPKHFNDEPVVRVIAGKGFSGALTRRSLHSGDITKLYLWGTNSGKVISRNHKEAHIFWRPEYVDIGIGDITKIVCGVDHIAALSHCPEAHRPGPKPMYREISGDIDTILGALAESKTNTQRPEISGSRLPARRGTGPRNFRHMDSGISMPNKSSSSDSAPCDSDDNEEEQMTEEQLFRHMFVMCVRRNDMRPVRKAFPALLKAWEDDMGSVQTVPSTPAEKSTRERTPVCREDVHNPCKAVAVSVYPFSSLVPSAERDTGLEGGAGLENSFVNTADRSVSTPNSETEEAATSEAGKKYDIGRVSIHISKGPKTTTTPAGRGRTLWSRARDLVRGNRSRTKGGPGIQHVSIARDQNINTPSNLDRETSVCLRTNSSSDEAACLLGSNQTSLNGSCPDVAKKRAPQRKKRRKRDPEHSETKASSTRNVNPFSGAVVHSRALSCKLDEVRRQHPECKHMVDVPLVAQRPSRNPVPSILPGRNTIARPQGPSRSRPDLSIPDVEVSIGKPDAGIDQPDGICPDRPIADRPMAAKSRPAHATDRPGATLYGSHENIQDAYDKTRDVTASISEKKHEPITATLVTARPKAAKSHPVTTFELSDGACLESDWTLPKSRRPLTRGVPVDKASAGRYQDSKPRRGASLDIAGTTLEYLDESDTPDLPARHPGRAYQRSLSSACAVPEKPPTGQQLCSRKDQPQGIHRDQADINQRTSAEALGNLRQSLPTLTVPAPPLNRPEPPVKDSKGSASSGSGVKRLKKRFRKKASNLPVEFVDLPERNRRRQPALPSSATGWRDLPPVRLFRQQSSATSQKLQSLPSSLDMDSGNVPAYFVFDREQRIPFLVIGNVRRPATVEDVRKEFENKLPTVIGEHMHGADPWQMFFDWMKSMDRSVFREVLAKAPDYLRPRGTANFHGVKAPRSQRRQLL